MSNYISVTFNKLHKVDAHYVYQWNRGQTLRINGLTLDAAQEIHFSLTPVVGEAVTRVGVTTDGVTDVSIPDTLFENDGKTNNYYVYVFIYAHQGDEGETVLYRVNIPVKARPKPEGYGTTDVTPEVFSDVINQVSGIVTNGVTQFAIAVASWSSSTTTVDGTAYYTYTVTLTNVYKPIPSVCIGSSSVLPTADEQTAYNCIKYSTVDADTLTLKLYAESVPTSAFYVKVIGAA